MSQYWNKSQFYIWGRVCPLTGSWDRTEKLTGNWDLTPKLTGNWDQAVNWELGFAVKNNWELGFTLVDLTGINCKRYTGCIYFVIFFCAYGAIFFALNTVTDEVIHFLYIWKNIV